MDRMLIAFQRSRPDSDAVAGKTAVLAGLAQCFAAEGRAVWACRLRSDRSEEPTAEEDAGLFLALPSVQSPGRALTVKEAENELAAVAADVCLLEHGSAPGIQEAAEALGARVVLVMRNPAAGSLSGLESTRQLLGERLLGVVANFVPAKSLEATEAAFDGAGVPCLAVLLEDRTLASPTLDQVISEFDARVLLGNANGQEPLEFPVIGPISADAGRPYFSRWPDKTVLTRSDRTDLQLAALDTRVSHIILTGGKEPSPYLIDRASRQRTTVLLVGDETPAAVQRIEQLYEKARFVGRRKIERAHELISAHLRRDLLP